MPSPLSDTAPATVPPWLPPRCSGESRGNKTPRLFNKHRHYLNRPGPMYEIPPKADIPPISKSNYWWAPKLP